MLHLPELILPFTPELHLNHTLHKANRDSYWPLKRSSGLYTSGFQFQIPLAIAEMVNKPGLVLSRFNPDCHLKCCG